MSWNLPPVVEHYDDSGHRAASELVDEVDRLRSLLRDAIEGLEEGDLRSHLEAGLASDNDTPAVTQAAPDSAVFGSDAREVGQ